MSTFEAARCAGTTDSDPAQASGPVSNLLSVFGQRLTSYNEGRVVPLYNSMGAERRGRRCAGVRYDPEVGGPVSQWMFCTDLGDPACTTTEADGSLAEDWRMAGYQSFPAAPFDDLSKNARLTADQDRLISYLIQKGHSYQGVGVQSYGGVTRAITDAGDNEREALQTLIWCVSDPEGDPAYPDPDFDATCAKSMGPAEQQRLLNQIPDDPELTLDVTSPTASTDGEARFEVTTNVFDQPIELTATEGDAVAMALCAGAGNATLSGGTLTVHGTDPDTPVTVAVCATSETAGKVTIKAEAAPPATKHMQWAQSPTVHNGKPCQVFANFLSSSEVILAEAASVTFDEPEPVVPARVDTTAVDKADDDHTLAHDGGTIVDTVDYTGLEPGTTYTIKGELMDKATGQTTGITGEKTFTPDTADGSVEVEFTVDDTHAGATLVAFEHLYAGADQVAEHTEIDDAAQTVTLDEEPVAPPVVEPPVSGPDPTVDTTAVDKADDDHTLAHDGGTIVDTVDYTGLEPGTTYTIKGELMDKATGQATGITGEKTFTPAAADGSVEVEFTVDDTHAGATLVAFEHLYAGADQATDPVAEHTEIDDAAQTVTLDEEPVVPPVVEPPVEEPTTEEPTTEEPTTEEPAVDTTATDKADGDHTLAHDGGVIVDRVDYTGLVPGTEYTIKGELMDKATSEGTGITAQTTFTPTKAHGRVELDFTIDTTHEGQSLVAFEHLYDAEVQIAEHADINDTDQTVHVDDQPILALPNAGGPAGWLLLGGLGLSGAGLAAMLRSRRRHSTGENLTLDQLLDRSEGEPALHHS